MGERPTSRGVTVLDGIALVIGAALASVHVRSAFPDADEGSPSWGFVAVVFVVLALTASGPFVFVLRHAPWRVGGRRRPGECLWGVLGLPWALGAVMRTIVPRRGEDGLDLLTGIGLVVACMIALVVAWKTWVAVVPDPSDHQPAEPWTEFVGLGLAVAWPVQCGLGLILLGNR